MNIQTLKEQLLDLTGQVGSVTIAAKRLKVSYTVYSRWEREDPHFSSEVKKAEEFAIRGYNAAITALSKQRLYELLSNGGYYEETTQRKYLEIDGKQQTDDQGKQICEVTIKRVKKGLPLAAIREGLNLISPTAKAVETLIAKNAMSPNKVTLVINEEIEHEQKLARIVSDNFDDTNKITPEQLQTVIRSLTGDNS